MIRVCTNQFSLIRFLWLNLSIPPQTTPAMGGIEDDDHGSDVETSVTSEYEVLPLSSFYYLIEINHSS